MRYLFYKDYVRSMLNSGRYSKLDKLDQFYYLCGLDSELKELLEEGFKNRKLDIINIFNIIITRQMAKGIYQFDVIDEC